jgi:phosphopantetheine--protein transferase-like protein
MSYIIGVEIYFANVNDFAIQDLPLTKDESLALSELKSSKRQKEWAISKWLRRKILSEKIGVPEEILVFNKYDSGKPFLSDPVTYYFNISHSHDWVVLAVCRKCDIGIDIQKMNLKRNILGIAQNYFSQDEAEELGRLSQKEQRELFYTLWVLKEAALKSQGRGIAGNLSQYSFKLNNNLTLYQESTEQVQFVSYKIESDSLCAIALNLSQQNNIQIQVKSYRIKLKEKPKLLDLKSSHYQILTDPKK